jgi:hypothetical protein
MVMLKRAGFRRLKTYLPTVLLVIAAVALAWLWWLHGQPARTAKQLQSSRQVLLDTSSELQQLPTPSAIQPGQSGGTAGYQVKQLQQAEDTLAKKHFNPPSARLVFSLTGKPISDINALYSESRAALASTRQTVAHEAVVMAAVQKTLEYNAALDFKKYVAGSSDTQTRLQKAKTGIANATSQLQAVSLASDPTQPDLVNQLSKLAQARDNLEQTGDVPAWSQAVNEVQTAIIANRQAYWTQQVDAISTQLQNINNQLAHLQADIKR